MQNICQSTTYGDGFWEIACSFLFGGGITIAANNDTTVLLKNVTALLEGLTALLEIATALLEKMSVKILKSVTISR
jgi:hypothetical protein